MNRTTRLPLELQRLFLPQAPADASSDDDAPGLVDAAGRVRAMVLELARPADWAVLRRVWQGVQADLDLPAPAIAVSGQDAYQLWFSLAQPLPAPQAAAFLEALRQRYLGEIPRHRVRAMPNVDEAAPLQLRHAAVVPAAQAPGDRWSAFVSPDLAPMFAETPWLDMPPNPDGQAGLLAPLQSMQADALRRAMQLLGLLGEPAAAAPVLAASVLVNADCTQRAAQADPRRFLLEVMQDSSVALALRIEAAKALLPYVDVSDVGTG